MTPTFLSVFAGIGGFDLAFTRAGWQCAGQIEIDPYARRVLEDRFPEVPRHADATTYPAGPAHRVDAVVGGPPCQDFSVAGRRAGLDGERGTLFGELLRIARRCAARWIVAENVPGILSSGSGRDWAAILAHYTGFEPSVPADGWRSGGACVGPHGRATWRVLDARYFGVPQSRRRVFLVVDLGAGGGSPAAVLFEPESLGQPYPAVGGAARRVAASLAASRGGASGKERGATLIAAGDEFRALTVTERERLQGFPDGWTDVGLSRTRRCQLLGNAVAVPVVEWIARRLRAEVVS